MFHNLRSTVRRPRQPARKKATAATTQQLQFRTKFGPPGWRRWCRRRRRRWRWWWWRSRANTRCNCNGNNNNGCCCCSHVVVVAVAYYWLGLVKSFVMFLSWCPVTLICCRKCNFWHRGCRLPYLPATVVIGCIQWTSPGDVIRWRTSRGKWKRHQVRLELSVGALQ